MYIPGKFSETSLASANKNAKALRAQHHLLPSRSNEIVDRKIIALHKHNWFRMCFSSSDSLRVQCETNLKLYNSLQTQLSGYAH